MTFVSTRISNVLYITFPRHIPYTLCAYTVKATICTSLPEGAAVEADVVSAFLQEMLPLIENCVSLLPKPFLLSVRLLAPVL